ncbi:MAG: hypothetical protein IKP36_04980 [Bacteroidaceae bacterium]|nr:hypothetical protein [Bacteroidaceae bacterium]
MQNLTIRVDAVVAPLVQGRIIPECGRISKLAKEKVVELHFIGDYVRIIGECSRKVKVPQKALKDGEALIAWMEQRIEKAWNN